MTLILTLASRNLFHDRVRLVATLVGIVFSIVLVTVQLGLYLGFDRMITTMIDRAQVDLWIVPSDTMSFESASVLDGRQRFQALATSGVTAAVPLLVGFAPWSKPQGGANPVVIIGFDPAEPGLRPWNIVAGSMEALATPDAVAVDRTYLDTLGVTGMGATAQIRDRNVRVAALTHGIRSFTTSPFVFAPIERARAYLGAGSGEATYFLVRLAPGTDAGDARRRIAANVRDADVITSEQFRSRSRTHWLLNTGAGAALLAGAVLGMIVGTVIVAQTLYSSTKDHLPEFATLRAIGSSARYIHQVILWQALISAVLGFAVAGGLGWLIVRATADSALPIVMTPMTMVILFALTVAMCAVSAIAAIIKVTRIDPAMVFTR
jgi:putative ABC transport system permease protein